MSSATMVASTGSMSSAPMTKALPISRGELRGGQSETQALAIGHLEPARDQHESDQQA